MSWSHKFEEPVELPNGRKLRTLKEAMHWLTDEIPKSERCMPKVQTAIHTLTEAAENKGPMIFARRAMMQAIHWHHVPAFNTACKP
jgi:hypothetical protein